MEFMGQPVYVTPCSNGAGNQYWWYNDNRYLMRDYLCIGVLQDNEQVRLKKRLGGFLIKYDLLMHRRSGIG